MQMRPYLPGCNCKNGGTFSYLPQYWDRIGDSNGGDFNMVPHYNLTTTAIILFAYVKNV